MSLYGGRGVYFIPKLHIKQPKWTEVKQYAQSPTADDRGELVSSSVKLQNLPSPQTTTCATVIYLAAI